MNISIGVSSSVKSALFLGQINFAGNSFKAVLMRDDFNFSTENHQNYINIYSNTGDFAFHADNPTRKFTSSSNFTTLGFVPGNYFTTSIDGSVFKVSSIDNSTPGTSILSAQVVSGSFPATADYNKTMITNDIHGDSVIQPVTFDTDTPGQLYLNHFNLALLGNNTAPGAIVYNDTPASAADKTIIAYLQFSSWRINI